MPSNIDLDRLEGCELSQVAVGRYELQLHFHDGATPPAYHHISIEGRWDLNDEHGLQIDAGDPLPSSCERLVLLRLLGRRVVGTDVTVADSIHVLFDGSELLSVHDSNKEYESFSYDDWFI